MTGARTSRMAVVVVNFASSQLLRSNLDALAAVLTADDDIHIVVVDNFSSVSERRIVETHASDRGWVLVTPTDNRGFAAAVNRGVAAARARGCDSFLLLNPDAIVERDVVLSLRQHVAERPLDLVSPRIVSSDGGWTFEGSAMHLGSGRSHRLLDPDTTAADEFPWATGACLAVHDQLLSRVGDLDERYFMYWEDVDLSYRAKLAGGRVVVRRDLEARHDEGGTQLRRGRAKSALYYHYNARNRLLFAAAHLDPPLIRRWVVLSPRVGVEIVLRGGRRQLLRSWRPLLAVLVGTCSGVAATWPALRGGHLSGTAPRATSGGRP